MTAPEQPTWHVADDPYGEPTLFHGDTSVFRESDFAVAGAEYRDLLWDVLTRALAPDEAILMLLDQRVDSYALVLDDQTYVRSCVEDVLAALTVDGDPLAALAGTAAPHERDGEVGG